MKGRTEGCRRERFVRYHQPGQFSFASPSPSPSSCAVESPKKQLQNKESCGKQTRPQQQDEDAEFEAKSQSRKADSGASASKAVYHRSRARKLTSLFSKSQFVWDKKGFQRSKRPSLLARAF